MNIEFTVLAFGILVTTLVALGIGLTVRAFKIMQQEIDRGHGPHLVSDLKEYQPFTLKKASSDE